MNSVLKKLFEIQQELKVPKNQRNNFGNYNFRNCEDIMEASKPVCKKHNCLLTWSDEVIYVGDRYYIRATATLYDLDSNECVSATAEAREEETKKGMDASQITGASSSYARKYALNGLLQLDDNKDADTNEYQKQQAKKESLSKKNISMITDEQIKLIHVLFGKIEKNEKQVFKNFDNSVAKLNVYKKFKINSSKELTKDKAKELIELLQNKLGIKDN